MYLINFTRCMFAFCSIILLVASETLAQCSFAVNGDMPKREPVFLTRTSTGTFQIIHTTGFNIELAKNQQIFLACPGAGNHFQSIKRPRPDSKGDEMSRNLIEAKCISDKNLETLYGVLDISKFSCQKSITGNLHKTKEACAGKAGIKMKIGLEISNSPSSIWVSLFETCFNEGSQSAIYSAHSLQITIEYEPRPKGQGRPGFKQEGFTTAKPQISYQLKSQEGTFKKMLIDDKTIKDMTNTKGEKYLAIGHLTPDKDFQFLALRNSTYFFANAVPHWQSINNGNSLKVEKLIRLLNSRQPIDVYTGVHDIYRLDDKNANPLKLYLDINKKIEVPKWIWKIAVTSSKGKTYGIAFVTLNDPFVKQESKIGKICNNVCQQAGYGEEDKNNFKRLEKGYTYCCEVDDLRKVVKTIPSFHVDGLLKKGPAGSKESHDGDSYTEDC